jgi:hypothetical protein
MQRPLPSPDPCLEAGNNKKEREYSLGRWDDSCLLQNLGERGQQARCQVEREGRTVMARRMAKTVGGQGGESYGCVYKRGPLTHPVY